MHTLHNYENIKSDNLCQEAERKFVFKYGVNNGDS